MDHPLPHPVNFADSSEAGVLRPLDPSAARVLVVEDEPSIRDAFALALEDDRWVVETAEDGIAATAKVGEKRFGLLLADLRMPGLDGIGLIRRMRERGDFTPAMLCTADLGTGDFLAAVRIGVVKFLLKPVSLSTLRSVVESALCQRPVDPVEIAFEEAQKMNFGLAGEMLRTTTARDSRKELERWGTLFARLGEGSEDVSLLQAARLVLDDVKRGHVAWPKYGFTPGGVPDVTM